MRTFDEMIEEAIRILGSRNLEDYLLVKEQLEYFYKLGCLDGHIDAYKGINRILDVEQKEKTTNKNI